MKKRTPYLVSIMQTVLGWKGVAYEIEVMGLGYETPELAAEGAAKLVEKWNAVPYRCGPGEFTNREHRAAFKTGCHACRASGIEPGFKRKKCSACAGVGTLEGHVAPMATLGVLLSETVLAEDAS